MQQKLIKKCFRLCIATSNSHYKMQLLLQNATFMTNIVVKVISNS